MQPVAPTSKKLDINNSINDGGNNQKLKLFNLGKAISCAPTKRGINRLLNPPVKTGTSMCCNQ